MVVFVDNYSVVKGVSAVTDSIVFVHHHNRVFE